MALCAAIQSGYVALQSGTDPAACPGPVLLSSTEYATFQTLSAGFDPYAFGYAFAGGLLMFGIGFGIGMVISQIRKLRI
jgi:hypothetical protein